MALPGTAGGAQEESGDAGGADQGAAARRDGGVTPGTALVALRTGLDGVLALPHRRGRRQGVPLAPHPAPFTPRPCGLGPAVPGGGLPDRLGGVAQGPGTPARARDPQVRWLLPVQVPWTPSAASEALRSCCALTPGVVSGPPQGTWRDRPYPPYAHAGPSP